MTGQRRENEQSPCQCPFCNGTTTALPFCQSCGAEIVRCPRCGAVLVREQPTCPRCGAEAGKGPERPGE